MRESAVNHLKSEVKKIEVELEKLEGEILVFGVEIAEEKKIKKVSRLIYAEEFNRQNLIEILKEKQK